MTFPAYPEYKDSGVEWLGEVPSHWEHRRLKWAVQLLTQKLNSGAPAVALENIESWSGRFLESDAEYQGQGTSFERGDILFGKLRPYLAKVALAEQEGEAVGDFHVFRPSKDMDGRFLQLQMLTRWFISVVDGSTFGAKMPRASWDFMSQLEIAVPPVGEQTAIAAFLDRETGKIDALVAEQEKLIELLKEKRQAVISHAVTKGLDPNVPMKDSGVEWLGEVPEHWEVARLKRVLAESLIYGANEAADDDTPNNPRFVRITDIAANGELRNETFRSLPPELAQPYLLHEGDVLLARSGATVGKSFIYKRSWGVCCFAGYLIRARVDQELMHAQFLYECCQSDFYWQYILSEQIQATIQNVSAQRYGSFFLPIPPLEEQQKIIDWLHVEKGRLNDLIDEAQRAIDLLKERRSALISAAVTGKIDVRGLVEIEALQASQPSSASDCMDEVSA